MPMKTTILLLLLLLSTVQAAVPVGGVRINSDSTGTNTRSAAITVTLQTNLNSGVVNATNSVNVGQVGQAGVVNIGSTTTSNFFILTTTSTNALVSINATDDFDHAALTIIVTNEISSADLLHLQNGTNVMVYIQASGSLLARTLWAEDSPASDNYTRIQPTDFKINSGTNTNYFFVEVGGTGEINRLHEGTNTFRLQLDSGYSGAGTKALTDDGTYKTFSTDSLWTNNGGTVEIVYPLTGESATTPVLNIDTGMSHVSGNLVEFRNDGDLVNAFFPEGFSVTYNPSDNTQYAYTRFDVMAISKTGGGIVMSLSPNTASGSIPYVLDTGNAQATNSVVEIRNTATNIFTLAGVSGYSGTGTLVLTDDGTYKAPSSLARSGQIGAACSDETTALTTGTNKVRFRMPYAMTLTAVRASLTTAQTAGSILTVDINEGGTSILSTKITIDDNETTSTSAATPPVISDSALADDAIITVDIDQVGTSPAGLKIWLIGTY